MSRRLYFDIETSPNVVLSFRVGRDISIDHDNIIRERSIICICYKWEHDPRVYSFTWDPKQNDKQMLAKFIRIAKTADELVGHNGDRYDIRWLRARAAFHRLDCPPDFVSIDTLKQSRSGFAFNSNRLDYLGKFLGFGGKRATGGFGLWKSILLNNDKVALAKMVRYCERDVRLLQKVHAALVPYTKHKVHRAVHDGGKRIDCPECTSEDQRMNANRTSTAGVKSVQLQCNDCGKYHLVPRVTYDKVVADRIKERLKASARKEIKDRVKSSVKENRKS